MARGGVVRVALAAGVATLDPWTAVDADTLLVQRQIYETLTARDGGRVVPWLASAWTVSSDGLVWRFTMRSGVVFQDGAPFDANAAAASLTRAQRTPGPLDVSAIEDATATDAHTLVVRLRAPYAPLLATLAAPPLAIVSPACLASDAAWADPRAPCAGGTGPFQVARGARPPATLSLAANPRYWRHDAAGGRLPYLDGLTFLRVGDPAARLTELRDGGAEVGLGYTAPDLADARADPNLDVMDRPPGAVVWLGIGAGDGLAAGSVRRAVAMAIDRDALVRTVFAGRARPAAQLVPPGVLGHDDSLVAFTRYDPAAARAALVEAGASPLALVLAYPSASAVVPDAERLAQVVANELAKIGVTATPRAVAPAALASGAASGSLALWIDARAPLRGDPSDFVVGWDDPIVRELLRTALGADGEAERAELYKQVAKIAQQQVAFVPLVYPTDTLVVSGRVRGLVAAAGGESYDAVWIGR